MWTSFIAALVGMLPKGVGLLGRLGASPLAGLLGMIDPRVALAGGVVIASVTSGYLWGHADAASVCAAAAYAQKLAVAENTLAVTASAARDASARAATLAAKNDDLSQKVRDYEDQLHGQPVKTTPSGRSLAGVVRPDCQLKPADIERLRAIR